MGNVGGQNALGVISSILARCIGDVHDAHSAIPGGGLQDQNDPCVPVQQGLGEGKPFLPPGLTLCCCGHMEKTTSLIVD